MDQTPQTSAGMILLKIFFYLELILFIFYTGCSILFQLTIFSARGLEGTGGFTLNPFLIPVPIMVGWLWGCIYLLRANRLEVVSNGHLKFFLLILLLPLVFVIGYFMFLTSI